MINMGDQQSQKQNRKFGEDRLKIKINFSPDKKILEAPKIEEASLSFNAKYELGAVLGQGAHAIVKKTWKKFQRKPKIYAVKIIRSGDCEIQDAVQRTYQTVLKFAHPGIIKVKELFIEEKVETSFFVMELCPYPSLEAILKKRGFLNESKVRRIMKNILDTVSYIHSCHVCHRDLKPDNLLVDEKTGAIKIIDFGVSSQCIQYMWTQTGNVCFRAPEIHTKCGYNEKIDIWSLGVVMYQSLTGALPFQEQSVLQTIHIISNSEENDHWETESFLSLQNETQDLLKKMLERNSELRLSAQECLEHSFFTSNQRVGDFHIVDELEKIEKIQIRDLRSENNIHQNQCELENNYLDDFTLENSMNSSFGMKPQIHHIKGFHLGKIDLVSSYRMGISNSNISIDSVPKLSAQTNGSNEDFTQVFKTYRKSSSHEDIQKIYQIENSNDTSFDQYFSRHQMQESITQIVVEEDESIDQIVE